MKEVQNVYAVHIEFTPDQKRNRLVYVLSGGFNDVINKMVQSIGKLNDADVVRSITMIAEDVIY